MKLSRPSLPLCVLLVSALSPAAFAQSTGGLFGPSIKATDRSVQYRSAYSFDDESSNEEAFAHRVHYQYAFNDSHRGRVVVSGKEDASGDLAFSSLRGEYMWQYADAENSCWKRALRFDYVMVDSDFGADKVGFNWTNECAFADDWKFRGILLTSVQVGPDAKDGVGLGTRFGFARKVSDSGTEIGVEFFNDYGRTGNIEGFDEQKHTIGPFVSGKIDVVKYRAGVLFGTTDASRDADLRLWFGYAF